VVQKGIFEFLPYQWLFCILLNIAFFFDSHFQFIVNDVNIVNNVKENVSPIEMYFNFMQVPNTIKIL
jgi:hypothetical protein